MNKSPIVSISLHPTGKMLLALYQNGMLRLWNLMEARCKYKRKVNLNEDKDPSESENEDPDLIDIKILKRKDLNPQQLHPLKVQWEPSKGQKFAILYNNLLEVYNVDDATGADKPCSLAVYDIQLTSLAFVSDDSLVLSDQEGNIHLMENIHDQSKLSLKQINTKFSKIR